MAENTAISWADDPNATGRALGAQKSAANKAGCSVEVWRERRAAGERWCYRSLRVLRLLGRRVRQPGRPGLARDLFDLIRCDAEPDLAAADQAAAEHRQAVHAETCRRSASRLPIG
jgi:hypothetical protein